MDRFDDHRRQLTNVWLRFIRARCDDARYKVALISDCSAR